MPEITLPDGSKKSFPDAVTGLGLAESIGSGLAKAAVAVRVDGKLRDLGAENRRRRRRGDHHANLGGRAGSPAP